MILSSSRRPHRSQFAQTRRNAEIAGNAQQEAPDEGDRTARGHDDADDSGVADPCAVWFLRVRFPRVERAQFCAYFKIANVMAIIVTFEKRCSRCPPSSRRSFEVWDVIFCEKGFSSVEGC